MDICINPQLVQEIELDECIGLSLAKLNSNFAILEDSACENYDTIVNTIVGYDDLRSEITSLSSYMPFYSKASVISSEEGFVRYNVEPIIVRNAGGVYTLTFTNPFPNTNYAVIATAITGINTPSPSALTVTPATFNNNNLTINICYTHNLALTADPDYLTLEVYY